MTKLAPVSLAACLAWSMAATALEPLPLEEIAPGVHVYYGPHGEADPRNAGSIGNAVVIVGEESAAVVDTGGSLDTGRRLAASVAALTPLPVRYVVNTHGHPDHVFGNGAFDQDGVEFVGHHKLPRALAMRGPFYLESFGRLVGPRFEGTRVVPPERLVEDSLRLDLGNRPLQLTAYPTGHTDNDLVVLDERSGTLIAGDLLFLERIPVVDGSTKGWLEVSERLAAIPAARVVPGHGPARDDWPAALAPQTRYLRVLVEGVRAEIARGGTIESAIERVGGEERGHWLLFEDNHPRNVTTTFTELEWE